MGLAPRIEQLNGFNNLIINGNMDFAQRGTSVSVGSSVFQYQADRFAMYRDTANAATYAVVADVPTLAQSGFSSTNSIRITNGTGVTPSAGQLMMLLYRMEGFDFASINTMPVRFQFWVKSSVAGNYSVCFRNANINRTYLAPYVINAANTWEQKVINLTMDQAGVWALNNTIGLEIDFGLGIGSSLQTAVANTWQGTNYLGLTTNTNWAGTTGATFQLAQVSLVQGSFGVNDDLPFKRAGRTIQQELAMCQRYYWQKNSDVTYSSIGSGVIDATNTNARISVLYPVSMRAIPSSFTATNIGNTLVTQGGDLTPTGIAVTYIGSTSTMVVLTTNAGTTGRGAIWLFTPTTPASVQADAEL